MELRDSRQAALESQANIRLVTGDPGVGKTFFGCKIAEWELSGKKNKLNLYQKILFLTFARNAVARIRQAYIQQISEKDDLSEDVKAKLISNFHKRIHVNTFAGFFWWLVESYGRYIPGNSSSNRLWLIGNKRTGSEIVPNHYNGITFSELEASAKEVLKVAAIQALISDLYPVIIIDEFQDVNDSLFEIIKLLNLNTRIVLLCGPGQCIYQGMKQFDPTLIMEKCKNELKPEQFHITPKDQQKQRYCAEINELISQYNAGGVSFSDKWPIKFQAVSPRTLKNHPKELETQAGKQIQDMKDYFKETKPGKKFSLAVLASTNQGVAKLFYRFRKGSDGFALSPIPATLHFDDALLLQYGRLILHLLKGHWSSVGNYTIETKEVAGLISCLFQQADRNSVTDTSSWEPLAGELCKKIKGQRGPKDNSWDSIWKKVLNDLESVNKYLRAPLDKLPDGSPSTPFTKTDSPLLQVLRNETLRSIVHAFNHTGSLLSAKAIHLFENSMQKRIIFEKLGIESGVQVMTIHKSKGREFDGVVLVLEDNRKALWRNESNTSDTELEDLYRVGISRARDAFGLTAYNNIYNDAKPAVQKLLPDGHFSV
jgi:DNA helicase-2/ATP-dependent DNA helicase PcrA